jgi:hypothetical protein
MSGQSVPLWMGHGTEDGIGLAANKGAGPRLPWVVLAFGSGATFDIGSRRECGTGQGACDYV